MSARVTPETLTDEQIRNAREEWPESIGSEIAADALGLPLGPYDSGDLDARRKYARQRVCDAINARAAEGQP